MSADPVEAMLPAAAALAVAVCDYDPDGVAEVLTTLQTAELHALAIALAANVDLDKPLTITPEAVIDANDKTTFRALQLTAEMFNIPIGAILSTSRRREHADARAVAMYVCRLAGMSSPNTGSYFNRDHSTVLHAWGRVGESARLRGLAHRVAIQCGWMRDADVSA